MGKFINKKTIFTAVFVFLLALAAGSVWYFYAGNYQLTNSAAQSAQISQVNAPKFPTISDEKTEPSPLEVSFSTWVKNIKIPNYEKIEEQFDISPEIRGKWMWRDGEMLTFTPEKDWLPDTRYKVTLPESIFSPNIKIENRSFAFTTLPLTGKVSGSEFYENPKNLAEKSAVAAFQFNYPLNTENLKDKISVKTTSGQVYDFTYKLEKQDTLLHVVSAPLKIGEQADFAYITISGAENAYNKKAMSEKLTASVKIPGSSTFFKLQSIKSAIARDEKKDNAPEQVLVLKFSTAVESTKVAENLKLYFIDTDCTQAREQAIKSDKKHKVQQLEFSPLPSGDGYSQTHIFKYDINKTSGCIISQINKGLRSVEGYALNYDIVEYSNFTPYPLEVDIMSSGTIMPRNGSREVGFVSHGADKLNITVARVYPDALNHLVTQTYGSFDNVDFTEWYSFDEQNISEIFEKNLNINSIHPAKADYSSLNLNEYLQGKKGIFIIQVKAQRGNDSFSEAEKRLIVLTDLGIVVKDNLDGSHDIFVSDISAGQPMKNAKIEVLGKNGIAVLSATTDGDGFAQIPDFSNFKKEKTPVVYKVSKGDDLSFIPIWRGHRDLDFSRFDVGGEYTYDQGQYSLKGYIFSDRGIYRPGEEAYFGMIVRQNDLQAPQKLPLNVKIYNPNGDVVSTGKIVINEVGLNEYRFNIPPTAVTGLYRIELYTQNKEGETYYIADGNFKVDEFLPDNLRIKAAWMPAFAEGWMTKKDLKATVSLYNLYGNPAQNHELKADYTLTPSDFQFKQYSGYTFRDPLRNPDKKVNSYQNNLPPQRTDVQGNGEFNINLEQFAGGTYKLRLGIEGFEAGSGRGVKTFLSALVSPNKRLIGWKSDGALDYINKGAKRKIDFVAIDNQLQRIAEDNLFITLNRSDMIYSLVEMPNGTYRYQMVKKETAVSKANWQISAEGATETLKTDEAGQYILRIENQNGDILAAVEYTVAGDSNLKQAVDKEAGLNLKLNRSEYNSGDEIEMQITAPYNGYGLITIERDAVYAYKWFKADTQSAVQTIKLPDNVEGNAYVNVAFFRDMNSPEIYMPPMGYAVMPFSINRAARRLNVDLQVPETVKPGDELVIDYKTSHNAKIIVYGVNQGILQVARYRLPDLLGEFLKKKALRVVTRQIMDLIMPDFKLLRNLASSGGDTGYDSSILDSNLNPFARKNAKPVAFWSGVIDSTPEGGTYRYKVPETFNGEIKVMAVAVSDKRFGSAEKSVLSRGDFVLIPSGPLNVSPDDEFVIGVSIANLVKDSGAAYPIEVAVRADDGFEVIGNAKQTVEVDENGEISVKFRLKALSVLGDKIITFTAQSLRDADKKAVMPYTMSLRPSVPYNGKYTMGHARSKYKLSGIENLYPEFRVQQISASSSPLVLASGLLKYLNEFPHWCTEQTISKIFPAIEVFFKTPELVKNIDVYALFDDVVAKLRERQNADGGFAMWTENGMPSDDYASVYAAHFLVLAHDHGFNVPENMLNRALAYCAEHAAKIPGSDGDFIPTYATYVLTVSGKVTSNYLVNLEEYFKNNRPDWQYGIDASLMAASYMLLQDKAKAETLAGKYRDGENETLNFINNYLLAKHFPDIFRSISAKSVDEMFNALKSGNYTTKSSSWAILALNAFDSAEIDKNIEFSGHQTQYTPFPTADFTPQTVDLTVTSPEPFYYVVTQQGFDVDNKIAELADGIEVTKGYYDEKGNPVTSAKLGDELTVKISYRSLKGESVDNVAIVDLLAGCFQIVENSFHKSFTVITSDIREDRFIAHVTATKGSNFMTYKVKVIAEGEFTVPAVYASALYQPLVRANSSSSVIKVGE